MSSTASRTDWRKLVLEVWPAVTASNLLRGNREVWLAEGLSPPSAEEAVTLAAVGLLVRYGQSVEAHLPISREPTLPRLAFYLHRLRLDAAQGLVRSAWLNRVDMNQRLDLLIFGRPRRMLRDFVTSNVMRPTLVYANTRLESVEFQRTLLIDGHGDLLSIVETLASCSRPFAIVLDLTEQGCADNAVRLSKALPSMFERVPIVGIGYTGQALDRLPGLHLWNLRLGDEVPFGTAPRPPQACQVQVLAARDSVMNDFARRLSYLAWNLKRLLSESDSRAPEMVALLTVERVLRGLNVPLAVHERSTQFLTRGGRFPVRTLEGWLEMASRIRGRRGDIQSLLDEILRLIHNNLGQLRDAVPGRSELLIQLGQEALKSRQTLAILVGSHRDALILQNWLEERLGPEAVDLVEACAMDGSTAVPPDCPSIAVYAAPMYPSRLHWLGLSAARKIVVCHPFEQRRVLQQVDHWWRANALTSARAGDKHRLWSLRWTPSSPLQDLLVEESASAECLVSFEERPLDGEYPRPLRVAQLDSGRHFEDWLEALLAEPPRHDTNLEDERDAPRQRDLVIIFLEGHPEPLRWPADRQIMRLEDDTFEVCPASELTVGNDLVLLLSSEERIATQRELFDMFVQNNHGLQQTLRLAEKWQEYVHLGITKFRTVAGLTRHLRSRKYQITAGAVQHWHAGRVIGPQDPAVIRILADAAEVPGAERMAKMVENAILAIRSEHRKIGSDLRRAITLSRGRDVSAVQIGSRRFSREVFDAMVEVCRIVAIDRPSRTDATVKPAKSIEEVARDFERRHADKLVFTTACEHSMARSVFEDLSAFEQILNVLVEGFYPMYADKTVSLKQVEERLAVIPASYAGQMSEVTKGKYESDYIRQYGGQKIDISRHIKLGRSFDPRHTLRLHFHWDDSNKKIVVHHAGAHLPTLNS